jgi:methylated-DNA-[protein]-cysteine S-methyltransferase
MVAGQIDTPVGPIHVVVDGGLVRSAGWGRAEMASGKDPVLTNALNQLADYFSGVGQSFDLPLAPVSGFAARMRAAMLAIPFGETRTYGDLARDLGVTAQAVGQGCGANVLPVIVPCHRVLGAAGLGGYSGRGGVDTKVALLRHEGAGGLLI